MLGEEVPAGQGRHAAEEAAPGAAEYVPAGQGMGSTVERGQKKPAGHSTGAPEAQKKEVGHGMQVS